MTDTTLDNNAKLKGLIFLHEQYDKQYDYLNEFAKNLQRNGGSNGAYETTAQNILILIQKRTNIFKAIEKMIIDSGFDVDAL